MILVCALPAAKSMIISTAVAGRARVLQETRKDVAGTLAADGLLDRHRDKVIREGSARHLSSQFLKSARLPHWVAKVAEKFRIGRQQHARVAGR